MGRISSIDRLTPELRERLHKLLARPDVTQQEITDTLNAAGAGVSKSAVNRYAVRMKQFGEKARQIKEATQAYVQMAGDQAEVSETIIHQLRIGLYDLTSALESGGAEGAEPEELAKRVDALTRASRGMRDLETAAKAIDERRRRLQVELAAAAEETEKTARRGGLSAEMVQQIKERILGVAVE